MDRRLQLSVKATLEDADKAELAELNRQLQFLQPGISERDPEYVAFLRAKYPGRD
jgi:hypothetical protein